MPAHRYSDHRQRLLPPVVLVALGVVGLALAIAAPLALYPLFLIKILCFALFASALNLVVGYSGLLSLGHAAFFGGSAYVAAHAAKIWGFSFEAAILAGSASAALLGLCFGLLAIRRLGIYFAMVTLALAQMIYFLSLQLPVTGGEDGIQSVPRGTLLGLVDLQDTTNLYYVVLAITIVAMATIWRTVYSPLGHILAAIRENETRATSLGLNVARYKLTAFVISAALSGLAGAMKAIAFQLASLNDVAWHMSGEVVLMTLLGGLGTLFGPPLGAAFVVVMEHLLSTSGLPVTMVIGIVFMACVMLFRRGFFGEVRERLIVLLRRDEAARV